MDRAREFRAKHGRVVGFLEQAGLDGILLRTRSNLSWLGSGPADGASLDAVQGSRSEIWHQSDTGVMAFVVSRERVTLVTENIELPRLLRDEFPDLDLDVVAQPWHESDVVRATVDSLPGPHKLIGTDLADAPLVQAFQNHGVSLVDLRDQITELRASLLPRELERYRWLGATASGVMTEVCRQIRPGTPESAVVADAHQRLHKVGVAQEVDIVCADDRLWQDRHGLYSDRRIERVAMVVFCAHKWGLVANLTRMIHFGPVPDSLADRHRAIANLDRRIMDATTPGVALADIFTGTLIPGYADIGEADAWRDHHQGGSTGYSGRDQRVTPTTEGTVQINQAFAWNPSLPGAKSEDTFVTTERGAVVLTLDGAWPRYEESERPAILSLGTQ